MIELWIRVLSVALIVEIVILGILLIALVFGGEDKR
jgi:L-asparagine transporter-like permease